VLPTFLEAHPDIEIEIGVSTSNVDLTRREADLALRASNQPPEHLYGREVGELRYAVFAHRRFFKGSKVPALEDLPLVGFDESTDAWISPAGCKHVCRERVLAYARIR